MPVRRRHLVAVLCALCALSAPALVHASAIDLFGYGARGMAMGRSAPPAGGAIGYGGPGAALPAPPRTPLYARAVQQYAQRSTTSGG